MRDGGDRRLPRRRADLGRPDPPRRPRQVLAALAAGDRAPGVRRLDDVHLRGLLTLLADDARADRASPTASSPRAARRSPSSSAPARDWSTIAVEPVARCVQPRHLRQARTRYLDSPRLERLASRPSTSARELQDVRCPHQRLHRRRRSDAVEPHVQGQISACPGAGGARRGDQLSTMPRQPVAASADVRAPPRRPGPSASADGLTQICVERRLEQAVRLAARRRRTPVSRLTDPRPPRSVARCRPGR